MPQPNITPCASITREELAALRDARGLPEYRTPEQRKHRVYGIIDWEAYDRREALRAEKQRERQRRKAAELRRQRAQELGGR